MKQEQFNQCKQDLLITYKDVLCEESDADIKLARTPEELVRLLHKFATFLHYKVIPSAEWARKWFGEEKALLNKCGVYLDQVATLTNPEERNLVIIGNSRVSAVLYEPHLYNITLQDESELSLSVFNVSCVTVREKGTGSTNILAQSKYSKVKIHKI